MTDGDGEVGLQLMKRDVAGRVQTTAEQREAVLDAYEASGLSGPEFARVYGVKYQTFATWRQKRRKRRACGA